MLERHLAYIFIACHNHARHPEEDDVRTRHQVGSGVVVGQFLALGIVDAVEQRDRPQPTGEPSVECILVLMQVGIRYGWILLLSQFQSLLSCFCYHEVAFLIIIIRRNAVSPPQLARDAPVLDVLQPVLIGVLVFLRIELDIVGHYWWQGDIGKVLHLEEPLQRETRLNGCIGVALRIAHLIRIVLNALHQSCLLQIFGYLLAANHAVHTDIEGRLL